MPVITTPAAATQNPQALSGGSAASALTLHPVSRQWHIGKFASAFQIAADTYASTPANTAVNFSGSSTISTASNEITIGGAGTGNVAYLFTAFAPAVPLAVMEVTIKSATNAIPAVFFIKDSSNFISFYVDSADSNKPKIFASIGGGSDSASAVSGVTLPCELRAVYAIKEAWIELLNGSVWEPVCRVTITNFSTNFDKTAWSGWRAGIGANRTGSGGSAVFSGGADLRYPGTDGMRDFKPVKWKTSGKDYVVGNETLMMATAAIGTSFQCNYGIVIAKDRDTHVIRHLTTLLYEIDSTNKTSGVSTADTRCNFYGGQILVNDDLTTEHYVNSWGYNNYDSGGIDFYYTTSTTAALFTLGTVATLRARKIIVSGITDATQSQWDHAVRWDGSKYCILCSQTSVKTGFSSSTTTYVEGATVDALAVISTSAVLAEGYNWITVNGTISGVGMCNGTGGGATPGWIRYNSVGVFQENLTNWYADIATTTIQFGDTGSHPCLLCENLGTKTQYSLVTYDATTVAGTSATPSYGAVCVLVADQTPNGHEFTLPASSLTLTVGATGSGTWSVVTKPGGAPNPAFSVNGTAGAKNTVASPFDYSAGQYTFRYTNGAETSDVSIGSSSTGNTRLFGGGVF
jgi:hypothetical protein